MTTRSFVFTIFDLEWSVDKFLSHDVITRAAVQKEQCPDTGKIHFQGFAQLVKVMRYNAIKRDLLCETAHVEACRGTPQQAWEYCTKEESRIEGPWTKGELPLGAGKRREA